ncbi:MAG: TolC family protein [Leptolyngbya sp. BL-A-14]
MAILLWRGRKRCSPAIVRCSLTTLMQMQRMKPLNLLTLSPFAFLLAVIQVAIAQAAQPPRPSGPAVIDHLNPSPNPLLRPSYPKEVAIQLNQPITLQQALELGLRNNKEVQVQRLTVERYRASFREAQGASYPTLKLDSTLQRSQSASDPLNTISDSFTSTLSLSYDLFTAGKRPAAIQAAALNLRYQELELERLTIQNQVDIATAYYDSQKADENVRIQTSAVTNAEQSLRDTQAKEAAGTGTRFDTLQAQVTLANARQDLVSAQATQDIDRRKLVQLLSLGQSVNVTAGDPVVVSGTWNLSLEESIVLAFKNRADPEQQLVQREVSQQQRRSELAAIRPTVSLSANYEALKDLDTSSSFTDGYSVSGTASWTLFDGGAAKAKARQQERNVEIYETQFASQLNQIRYAVEENYANLQSNLDNIRTTEIAVGQAQEALKLARLRYQAGVGTQTDVISAETSLTQAEGNRVNAIIGYNQSLASLTGAVGYPLSK